MQLCSAATYLFDCVLFLYVRFVSDGHTVLQIIRRDATENANHSPAVNLLWLSVRVFQDILGVGSQVPSLFSLA